MPIVYFNSDGENTLKLEPYITFDDEFKKIKGVNGDKIEIVISDLEKQGFGPFDACGYSSNFKLSFEFFKDENEIRLIHHTITYDFDDTDSFTQETSLEYLYESSKYFYIEGTECIQMSFQMMTEKAIIKFDVVTKEKSMDRVRTICHSIISNDIAIFSRG